MSALPLWQQALGLIVLVPVAVVSLWYAIVGAIGWRESVMWERRHALADEWRQVAGTEYQPRERIVDDRWTYEDRHDFARHARSVERQP